MTSGVSEVAVMPGFCPTYYVLHNQCMDANLADEMIVLRAMTIDDAQALVDGEDDETVRWLTGGPGTLETAGRHIITSLEQWRTAGPRRAWGIYDQETGLLAGTAEVHLAL